MSCAEKSTCEHIKIKRSVPSQTRTKTAFILKQFTDQIQAKKRKQAPPQNLWAKMSLFSVKNPLHISRSDDFGFP